MTDSLITKKIIAYSFKKLMETEPYDKISVSDIMRNCDMRRQTFYYHFQDKHDLLSWIYREESKENITDFIEYDTWENIFERLLEYFYDNQKFYRNAFRVTEQNSFNEYLFEHTKKLYLKVIDEFTQTNQLKVSVDKRNFIASFYSYGFIGTVKDWIENYCQMKSVTMSKLMEMIIHNQLLLLLQEAAKE